MKRIELAFDGAYLLTAALLGSYLIATAVQPTRLLWGIMAVTLALGDAFHLLPRMATAHTGNTERYLPAMGSGKLVTSLTMTVFYLLLWHCGLQLFVLTLPMHTAAIYLLAAVRVSICLLPQNRWRQGDAVVAMGIYRNIPFVLQGVMVVWLYTSYAGQVSAVRLLGPAVLISFACYLPVVLWVHRKPRLGMLMLPKTCAYIWIICMGLGL